MKKILPNDFVEQYKNKHVNFGFNGVGEIAYKRSYSRIKENGENESWCDTVERVVNGCFNLQKRHLTKEGKAYDDSLMITQAKCMFDKIFNFKFLPPGRGLWAMGTKLTEEKFLYASLNNCAFVSTNYNDPEMFVKPFLFLMDLSMLGVGVGFDTKGAGKISIRKPSLPVIVYEIADSREGWVESVKLLLESYFVGKNKVVLKYDKIRKEGELLKNFGGISSGPAPLRSLHEKTIDILDKAIGEPITARIIIDIMNMIGKCIVSGNIRRSAEIAFGESDDLGFLDLKNYEKHPEREDFGWASNNTIFAKLGMDYSKACENIVKNGEPGFCWLDNMRAYGRMCDPPNYADIKASGGNPCLEQTLESFEMCCLVETFPFNHATFQEFEETLMYAFLYAKTVTLGLSHWEETNEITVRNRRIGCSMSGITQFITKHGFDLLKEWCDKGYKYLKSYDEQISSYFNVNRSIKITSIKPSGTVSLLAGATPGIHYHESRFYIRRIRIGKNTDLYKSLESAGYTLEKDENVNNDNAYVVEIPVSLGSQIKTAKEVPMIEQLHLVEFMQSYWADNQVSCTISFDPQNEGKLISDALNEFQYKLKGISFSPKSNKLISSYKQLPYEEISEEKYNQLNQRIVRIDTSKSKFEDPKMELFCDGTSCTVQFSK